MLNLYCITEKFYKCNLNELAEKSRLILFYGKIINIRKIFFAILIFFILKAVFSINRDNTIPNQSDYIKAQWEIMKQ